MAKSHTARQAQFLNLNSSSLPQKDHPSLLQADDTWRKNMSYSTLTLAHSPKAMETCPNRWKREHGKEVIKPQRDFPSQYTACVGTVEFPFLRILCLCQYSSAPVTLG